MPLVPLAKALPWGEDPMMLTLTSRKKKKKRVIESLPDESQLYSKLRTDLNARKFF